MKDDRPEDAKSFGQIAYEAYCEHVGWVSVHGERLPGWDDAWPQVMAAWETAASAVLDAHGGFPHERPARMSGLREVGGVKASRCQAGKQQARHTALRFVWHHILPQVCGGRTEAANLAELCDNCHYAVHDVMYALAHGHDLPYQATRAQVQLADQGYKLALAAGTAGKIPRED